MKKWKCGVCGYIHTGDQPPEKCPVCGADRSQFILLNQMDPSADSTLTEPAPSAALAAEIHENASAGSPSRNRFQFVLEALLSKMAELHAHPIAVHIPNGVLPVSVLFLLTALLFNEAALEKAAFYNLLVVLLTMPIVLFSGYNDWQRRFGGHMTHVFRTKIVCGAAVQLLTLLLVVWRLIQPDIVLTSGVAGRGFFLSLYLIAFGCAVVAGYMGGKLVIFPKLRK